MKKAALLLLFVSIIVPATLSGQLTGVKNIPTDYPTLTAAINDLNVQGVGIGGVQINVLAGNPQIAPLGGYQVATLTGTATNTIVITGNGNTVTAPTPQAAGALDDGIFKIIGADYVTIAQFIMSENPANTNSTPGTNDMTEWGVALLRSSVTEGAQHNNIVGNTISLNTSYTNTWGVYSNTRHNATAVTTIEDPTSANGANSFNTVFSNIISNVNMGVAFIGSMTAAFMDAGNQVGTNTPLPAGNSINNWGGSAAASAYVSNSASSYGILMTNQAGYFVVGNTLTTTLASVNTAFQGISQQYTNPPSGPFTNTISGNTLTMQCSAVPSVFRMIDCSGGIGTVDVVVDGNYILNCQNNDAASTSVMSAITVASAGTNITVTNNTITGNSVSGTSAGFAAIQVGGGATAWIIVNSNQIGTGSTAFTAPAGYTSTLNALTVIGGTTSASVMISANNFEGFVFGAGSTNQCTFISQTSSVASSNISNNTFTNLNINSSGNLTFINNTMALPAGGSSQTQNNSIVGTFAKAGGGIVSLYVNTNLLSGAGASRICSGNNFSDMTFGPGTSINGWNESAGAITNDLVKSINGNTFSNWSGTAAGLTVMNVNNSGGGTAVSNNTITNINGSAGITGILVGLNNQGALLTCENNTITGLTSSGGNISCLVLAAGSVTTLNVNGNVLGEVLTTTGTSVTGVNMSDGQTINIFKNKIYDFQNDNVAGLVVGISIGGATTVNVYNNLVGDLRAPNANAADPVNGINVFSSTTVNLHYNTIYLNASSTGTDFGSSGITANTTTTLEMINNFVINLSTPNGTGVTAAFRRSGIALGTYAATSDNNCLHAGNPSSNRLIFYDGTNSDQTITDFRTRVAPRDNNSITDNPPLLSYVGTSPDFLHVPPATASLLESGGIAVVTTTVDYDNDSRPGPVGSVNGGALAPDIGADEFDGIYILCVGMPSTGTATGSPASYCATGSFTLTLTGASSGPGISYQWQESAVPGGPYSNIVGATSDNYITASITSTTYYVCVVTCSVSGLSATSSEITATINPDPVVSVVPASASICQPGAIPVTLTASGADFYIWTPGVGLSSTTTASTDADPITTTTYTVIGTTTAGCTSTATITVTVNSTPTVTASAAPPSICIGSSSTLDATGASTFIWMPGSLSGSSVVVTPGSTTTYTVTGTDINGCTSTATTTVTVNGLPTVTASADFTTVCTGTNVTLSAVGASSYLWMPGSLPFQAVVVNPPSTTTYTVTGTDANGCTDTDQITITVNALPTVSATATPGTICAGSTVQLDGFGANTYIWTPGFLSGASVTDAPASTTTYTVTGTDVNGCTNTATTLVTVNPLPGITPSAAPSTICAGASTTLSALGAATYTWMPGSLSGSPVVDSPPATTTYTVTGDDGTGCTNTATITVTVNSLPAVTTSSSPSTICQGDNTTLTAGGASTYSWMPGSLSGSPVVDAPAATTTYTVTGTDGNGCTNTATTAVNVNPAPSVGVSATATTICEGSFSMLTGSGANTYLWMPGSMTGTNVPVSPTSTTTYTVTGTDVLGCTATATITITVNPLPVVNISGSSTYCQNGSTTLTTIAGSTHQWYLNGVLIPGATSISYNASAAGIYNVVVMNGFGCSDSASTGHALSELAAPTVSFTAAPSLTVCQGSQVTLSGTGAVSYVWSGGIIDGSPFTVVAASSYTVTGTDGNGCTNTAATTINVNPLPTVSAIASPASTVCSGSSVTLNGSGAVSYTWTGGVMDGVPFTATTTTTYTVTGTDGNGCTNTDGITINVNALPPVGIVASPGTTVCDGTPVTLNGTGAMSYSWTGGVSNGVPFTPLSTTSYTVTGTDGNGCQNTSSVTITVNPNPAVSFAVAPGTTVCAGTSVTLTGSGATSYSWTGGVTDGVPFAPVSTGSYTVTGTDGNGCTATASVTITVNPIPAVGATAAPGTSVCTGNAVTLNGSGAASYAWSGGVTDGNSFVPPSTTTYTVTGTDAFGCTNTATITITVVPLPTVGAAAAPSASICTGSSVTLNGTGASTYVWSGGVSDGVPFVPPSTSSYVVTGTDAMGCTNTATITVTVNPLPSVTSSAAPTNFVCEGTMVTLSGAGASSYTWTGGVSDGVPFAATSTTTYTVTGTDINGCTDTDTQTITVNPAPTIGTIASPGTAVCAGTNITLIGTGGTVYTWSGGVTDGVAFVPPSTTTYTVTGSDGIGCTNTATITITVNPLPTVSSAATPTTTVCDGSSVTLNGTGAATYSWTGGVIDGVSFTPVSSGTYTVTGTDVNGCTGTATTTISVVPTPTVSSTASPATTVCAGTSVTLSGSGAISYGWSGGISDGIPFIASTTTTYTVTGTGSNGCTATDAITITVNPAPAVGISVSPAPLVCSGTMVTLNGSGAVTYGWSGGVNDGVPFSAVATSTYTVTGTGANGCTNTAVATVTVTPSPTVSFAASPGINICYGTEITLDGTGAVTYTWSDSLVDGNPFIPTATDTFTVVGTDGNGCVDSAVAIVTVNMPPTISASTTPNDTVCENAMITLSGTGAASYAWSHSVTDNIAFAANVTTTYTVIGSDGAGCSDTATQTVTVIPAPVVSITGNSSFCTGGNTVLSTSSGSSYQWFMNGSPIAGANSSTYTATNIGVYNVWLMNSSGCGDSSATGLNVTMNAPPTVIANATDTSICRGSAVTLTGSGAASYAWSGGVNNGVPFTPLNTLTYTVVGTASNGCTNTDTITVVVNTIPFVSSTANPGYTVCEGTSVILNGTGAQTYSWTGSVTDGIPFAPAATSTYTVTGTDLNGCTNSASVTVTVNPNPVVMIGSDTTQCGGSIVLDAGNPGATYLWSDGSTAQVINATASSTYFVDVTNSFGCSSSDTVNITINAQPIVVLGPDDTLCATSVTLDALNPGAVYQWNDMSTGQTIVATSSGTYFVTATMPGGCSSTDTVSLILNIPPSPTLALPLDTICLNGGTITLNGESPAGGIWNGPGVSGNSFDPMVSGAGTFAITYIVTDTNGCSGSAVDSILVDPCLGTIETIEVAGFSVYPNPNNGDFSITISGSSSATVMIYNAAGQLVKTDRVMQGNVLSVSLETSGMYMITIVTEEGETVIKRVVVNR